MPDEVGLYALSFLFHKNSFFNPSDRFPTFKLDNNLMGTDRLNQVKVDVSLNHVSSEVKRFVDLYESTGHV